MMRYEIKTIGIWSFTKIFFFINLAMGVLMGILAAMIMGFFMTVATMLPPELSQLGDEGQSIGVMLILLPIIYGLMSAVMGTIMGVILVAIYNLMARAVGGLEIDFQPVADRWPQPAPDPGPQYAQAPRPQAPSTQPPPMQETPPPVQQPPSQPGPGPSPEDTRRPDDPGSFGSQQG